MNVKRTVEEVYLHFHLDEIFAYLVALWYGKETFSGIEKAKVIFHTDVPNKTPEAWAQEKKLILGGGGDICDEHRSGAVARLADTSASLLMCKHLSVQHPVVEALAAEVDYFDHNRGCPKTHLASCLKMFKHSRRGMEKAGMHMCWRIITAVGRNLHDQTVPLPDEIPLPDLVAKILMDNPADFDDEDARCSLMKIICGEAENGRLLFGLKNIYESLVRTRAYDPTGTDSIEDDLQLFVSVIYDDQKKFHQMRRLVRSRNSPVKWFHIPVKTANGCRSIRAAHIETDNPQAHTVLRTERAILTIVKNKLGNVTIQGDQEAARRIGLLEDLDRGIVALAAMCRFADLEPADRDLASWDQLIYRGDSPADKRNVWHLADKGWLSIYNGTHSHAAPPTRLPLGQIKRYAQIAFHPHSQIRWMRRRGLTSEVLPRRTSRVIIGRGVEELFSQTFPS